LGEDKEFWRLKEGGRLVLFVFEKNRTGDGRLGSVIPIEADGTVPDAVWLNCPEPQPKTEKALVGLIRRVMTKEYRETLIRTMQDEGKEGPVRDEAARHLGGLYAREAWSALEAQATKPVKPGEGGDGLIRASLQALFRIDEAKTIPICLKIGAEGKLATQVETAAWLLSRRPSEDPKAPEILLEAAKRWEVEGLWDHPLPQLMQAIAATGKRTEEAEKLVMRSVKEGQGNVLIVGMSLASQWKMREAVPRVCEVLQTADETYRYRGCASLAIAGFAGEGFHPFVVNKEVSEPRAREAAAEAFPEWTKEMLHAKVIECLRGCRVVIASRKGGSLYVLVSWQPMDEKTEPTLKTYLLYEAKELKLTVSVDKAELPMKPGKEVEPAALTLTFSNVGKEPIKLDTYDLIFSRTTLEVTGPDGESVVVDMLKLERLLMAPQAEDYPVIEPGKDYVYRWQPKFPGQWGTKDYLLTKPGEYRVKVRYENAAVLEHFKKFAEGSWTGSVVSNEIVLTVVAAKP